MLIGNLAADLPPTLPRYSLPVGRRLTYSGDDNFPYQAANRSGSFNELFSEQITVIGINPDGSIRVFCRSGDRFVQNRHGQPTTLPQNQPEDVTLTQVDIFPDGRLVSVLGGFDADPPAVLCPLPADQNELNGTWKNAPKLSDPEIYASAGPSADGQWIFTGSVGGLDKLIYGMTTDRTYRFDLTRGVITAIDTKSVQDYGFHGAGGGTTHLDADEILPPQQIASLAKDCATYFAADKAWGDQIAKVQSLPKDASYVAAAKKILDDAAAAVTDPDIKAQLKTARHQVNEDAGDNVEQAQRIASVTNKPVIDISANDLDNHPHKLGDYRGKVLVLDFWYRGCGWCTRAMPEMKKVAEDFKGKPVQFLGMNVDSDPNDAKFVVNALGLTYPTLKINFATANKFQVQGYPTILVIDPTGIVRDYDEGYSPDLRTQLDQKIQSALNGK